MCSLGKNYVTEVLALHLSLFLCCILTIIFVICIIVLGLQIRGDGAGERPRQLNKLNAQSYEMCVV